MLENLTVEDLNPDERKKLADQLSGQLAASLKPEPITSSVSLLRIQTEMQELGEQLADALFRRDDPTLIDVGERNAIVSEIMAITVQLGRYLTAETAKVDSYYGIIKHIAALVEQIQEEEKRMARSRRALLAALDNIKGQGVYVIQHIGRTKGRGTSLGLEGSHGRRLRLHPSPVSVEVTDVAAVPDEFLRVTATMGMNTYKFLLAPLVKTIEKMADGSSEGYSLACRDIAAIIRATPVDITQQGVEVSLSRIKAFIEAGQGCTECKGSGNVDVTDAGLSPCPRCEGSGRIPGYVPGARLVTDNVHLRCE